MSTQLNLTPTARFSAALAPRRESRDLTAAVARLTLLQNPSRLAPSDAPAAPVTPTAFGRRQPH